MPPPPAYPPPGLPNQDEDHLRQLSIFHYIYAGFQALFSFIGLIFVGMGGAMAFRPELFEGPDQPPPFLGGLFIGIGVFIVLLILGTAFLTFLAGRYINQRKHHTYCLVVAGFNCLSLPLGTALGVFTIVVLIRPTVKAMFGIAPRVG
jgi:hypothetical protein